MQIITKPVKIDTWSVQQIYDYLVPKPIDPAYGFKLDQYLSKL